MFSIELESVIHRVYVRKRPGVDHFMRVVGEKFEVVIFTASLAKYADPLLDILDRARVVKARLFREACVQHYGQHHPTHRAAERTLYCAARNRTAQKRALRRGGPSTLSLTISFVSILVLFSLFVSRPLLLPALFIPPLPFLWIWCLLAVCVWRLCAGNYVKDLSHLGRRMEDIVIVDNSPFSYMFQPDNSIAITSWFHDKSDRQLYELLPFLDSLMHVHDVATVLQRRKPQYGSGVGVPPNLLPPGFQPSVQDPDVMNAQLKRGL